MQRGIARNTLRSARIRDASRVRTLALTLVLVITFVSPLTAQSPEQVEFFRVVSDGYEVLSAYSQEHADMTLRHLSALSKLYNSYFRFDRESLRRPLRVRIFAERNEFSEYLSDRIPGVHDKFIYLHYRDRNGSPDLSRSELAGYRVEGEEEYRRSLTHQSAVQFMRSWISEPPLWLREGFALYFEKTEFDPESGEIEFRKNYDWIEPAQEHIGDGFESLHEFTHMSVEEALEEIKQFYAYSWSAVSFLINSGDPRYNRALWDAIAALEPHASLETNARRVTDRAFAWLDAEELASDFEEYVHSLHSYADLVETGRAAWEAGDVEETDRLMRQAVERRKDGHLPWYYLGLVAYDRGDYGDAEEFYRQALSSGADPALVHYARGLSAYAAGNSDTAIELLRQAGQSDPERYHARTESLILQIDRAE